MPTQLVLFNDPPTTDGNLPHCEICRAECTEARRVLTYTVCPRCATTLAKLARRHRANFIAIRTKYNVTDQFRNALDRSEEVDLCCKNFVYVLGGKYPRSNHPHIGAILADYLGCPSCGTVFAHHLKLAYPDE